MNQESDLSNPMKYRLPYELPDQNQDGFADNEDFQRAFRGLNMTRYEISSVFDQVDTDHVGKISQHQWNDFYISFITHFENSDTEPRDGVLTEKEVEAALGDIDNIHVTLSSSKREKYLYEIMETLTSRT